MTSHGLYFMMTPYYIRPDLAPVNATQMNTSFTSLFQSHAQHLLEDVHHFFEFTAEPHAMSHQTLSVLKYFQLKKHL